MRKISLLMLFALAFLFNAKATEIWTGSHAVTWGSALNLNAATFADAQSGNALKVFYTNASDGIELKANGVNIAGSRKNAWINGEGAYDLYLTPGAIDAIKAHGLEIVGENFTVTKVELNEVEGREGMTTMWRGLYWADEWDNVPMLFYPAIASVVDWNDYSAIRVYHEAGRSDFEINFKKSWEQGDQIGGIGDMTAGDGYVELPLTDERRALLASIDNELIVQFYKGGDDKAAFNVTEIALVEKPYIWKGNKHMSWTDGGLQIAAEKFAEAKAGDKIVIRYNSASDGIEFKVLNENFDHLAGSREELNFPNTEGSLEHFLTPKAVEELKAYGLELIGGNFNITRVELLDGKASLPEGVNVWTGYFWADEWTTMYLYWNGYRYVDFNDIKAIRFYHQANRSDFKLNVRDSWGDDGEIANIDDMTAGEGYMELPLTNYMREKIAASEHLLVQFNKESGDPFNVTDIVLVMEEPYTRTVTNGNYGTICLSRAAATIEGATMYRIVGGNASEGIIIEEVASMEAGKPYIFQASADQITVTMTGARAEVQDANGLIGNLGTDAITVPMDAFVLKNNLLYLVNSDVTIAPNRAYINMSAITSIAPAPGRVHRVIAVENQATGVESLHPSAFSLEKVLMNGQLFILRDGQLYNVTGVRVQ